jgi:hypothetical protein
MGIELGFRPQAGQTSAIESGLNSVASGIQSAEQTGGLTEISDSLESLSYSSSPIDAKQAGNIADSSAIPSPDSYFKSAARLGGESALQNFSDLASMEEVSMKLSDPKFNQQQGLQKLFNSVSNLEVPSQSQLPSENLDSSAKGMTSGDESSAIRRRSPDDESAAGIIMEDEAAAGIIMQDEAAQRESQAAIPLVPDKPRGSESAAGIIMQDEAAAGIRRSPEDESAAFGYLPGSNVGESQAAIPVFGGSAGESESVSAIPMVGKSSNDFMSISFFGDIGTPGLEDATATLTQDNAEQVLQNTTVFQRLNDFQDTLQNIVSLNQQTEGK